MACCVYDAVSVKWFAVASLLHLNPWIQDPDCTEDSTHSAALACEWVPLPNMEWHSGFVGIPDQRAGIFWQCMASPRNSF
jgi:hypothetical protein